MRVAVFAPTPSGGHPEYVFKLLAGMMSSDESLSIDWPVRKDVDGQFLTSKMRQDFSIPTMEPRESMNPALWILARLNPLRRHDVGFLRWLTRQRKYDGILIEEVQKFTLPLVVWAANKRSARSVIHLHNVRRHDFKGTFFDRIDERLVRVALRHASAVVVHSETNAEELIHIHGSGIRTVVVPHGVQPVVTRPVGSPDALNFLFFGVNRPNKGLEILIDAIQVLGVPATLTIAGHTPENNRIQTVKLISAFPFIDWRDGFVGADEVAPLFSGATAVILPYSQFSAQSGVLHLAIEHGVPVVVSDVGALGESVRELGNGLVVPPGSVEHLAQALRDVAVREVNERFRVRAVAAQSGRTWPAVGAMFVKILSGNNTI
jgi:glycosyltransferase involved in cell wall biosynthesis